MQFVDSRGREHCLACSGATSEAPLVAVTLSVKVFLQVKKAYEAHRRSPGYRERIPTFFTPREIDVWGLPRRPVPVVEDSKEPLKPRTGGRPSKFTAEDRKRISLLHSNGWPAKKIAHDLEELWRGQGRSGHRAEVTPRSINREIGALRRSAKQHKRQ
jgi:hypothetical protein